MILTCTGARTHHMLSLGQRVLMRKGHQPSSAPGGWGGWEEAGRCFLRCKHLRSKRQCWKQVFFKDPISTDQEKWGGEKNCVARSTGPTKRREKLQTSFLFSCPQLCSSLWTCTWMEGLLRSTCRLICLLFIFLFILSAMGKKIRKKNNTNGKK